MIHPRHVIKPVHIIQYTVMHTNFQYQFFLGD